MIRLGFFLLAMLGFSACGPQPKSEEPSKVQTPPPKNTVQEPAQQKVVKPKNDTPAVYTLRITTFNYLTQGNQTDEVPHQILTLSSQDRKRIIPLSSNPSVQLFAISDAGVLSFSANDLVHNRPLPHFQTQENPMELQIGRASCRERV